MALGMFALSLPRMIKFPLSLTRNITAHSMKNLLFHSLTQMEDGYDTISNNRTYTGFKNVLFELGRRALYPGLEAVR